MTKWERMWGYRDSQEVGLEAAILERVRNSSLVKWSCAENITGLKSPTEATGVGLLSKVRGPKSSVAAWRAVRADLGLGTLDKRLAQ